MSITFKSYLFAQTLQYFLMNHVGYVYSGDDDDEHECEHITIVPDQKSVFPIFIHRRYAFLVRNERFEVET